MNKQQAPYRMKIVYWFTRNFLLIGLIGIGYNGLAQAPLVGLLYAAPNVTDGYTLFSPGNNTKVYLIDNCGEIINDWTFSEQPGLTCYLLEDGTLLRSGKDSLELRDWDNNQLWSYSTTANDLGQHHDIEPLPNGNILCVVTDSYTPAQIIAEGRDPAFIGANFKLEKIVELQPIGSDSAVIAWEWKFIDHFVQDFNSTLPNFGVVIDKPELIDLNYVHFNNTDWIHLNAVDYNASLDQIMVSARHMSEIYIIDHSTTTAEAAGHTGGNSNQGGDILWRWGNPAVYQQGTVADQKIFKPHDAKWVETGYEDEGKISVMNNGGDGTSTFSSVHLITPEISGGAYVKQVNKFAPLDFEWSWSGSFFGNTFYETSKSGTQALQNGNFMICESSLGQASEVTKAGTQVWTYKNPNGFAIYDQISGVTNQANWMFRAEKYLSDYSAFFGKDMTPKGTIENQNSISDSCFITATVIADELSQPGNIIVNPIQRGVIQFNQKVELNNLSIIDITGKRVFHVDTFDGTRLIVELDPAIYFLHFEFSNRIEAFKILVQ